MGKRLHRRHLLDVPLHDGPDGLREATEMAILNANYIAKKLGHLFPVLYSGNKGLVAHECILDPRQLTHDAGLTVDDIAKRLMDYGFHGPTMSFPVPGTLMVEPTESEPKKELDRFIEAMERIHAEITAIINGTADKEDNVLKNSPHTAEMVSADEWRHPYSRSEAAYPVSGLLIHKFWPYVGRVDNVYGDRQSGLHLRHGGGILQGRRVIKISSFLSKRLFHHLEQPFFLCSRIGFLIRRNKRIQKTIKHKSSMY